MPNRLKILRSTTASVTPPIGAAIDYGRLAANLTDRKVWIYGSTGTPTLIASYTTLHSATQGYIAGDLVVQNNILYRCLVDIGPKAFSAGDWVAVSDFRDILLYRAPASQAQATVDIGAAGISFRINANAGQTAPLQQWRDAAGTSISEIRPDGYPGEAFGRPVFRVDQVAHSFTAVGQPARFDGTNWVLADASTEPGFAIGIVRRIISANAFEIQTAGRIDGIQNGAFTSGTFLPNTRYYVSTVTPGTLTDVAPPNADEENVVLHTLTGGSAIINIAFPVGAATGGVTTDVAVTQANPYTAIGQVAGYNGTWGLADGTSATNAPLGLISAVAGNDFIVRTAGLITGIEAAAAVTFPLTPGVAYYANAAGLLTATAPTGTPVAAAPVLWALSGTSGIVMAQPQSANILRPSQNLGDLTNVATAITNLGLDNVVRNTRRVDTGTGLTGGGDLTGNRTIALTAGSIASLALADTAVQPARQINSGTGLTGGGDLSANRTLSLTGQALALHNLLGAGLVARTGTDTFVVRSIAAGDGITVTNGAGTAGNPSIAVNGTVMRGANNLSDLASAPAALGNLGLTATAAELNRATQLAGRNLLLNALGRVNQEAYVSGTPTGVAKEFTIDLWYVEVSGESLTFTGSVAGRTMTAPAGGVSQVIGGEDNRGGTHVINWPGTATCEINGVACVKGATVNLTAGTDVKVTFKNGTFSDSITGPQLERGNIPTAFEWRPLGQEFELIQRYYQKITLSGGGTAVAANNVYADAIAFHVRMRGVPVVDFSGGTVTNLSTSVADNPTVSGCRIVNTATAAGQWNYLNRVLTANSRLVI